MTLRLGLLSTANINQKLLGGARAAEGVEVVAVASRDRERAEAYAAEHGLARAREQLGVDVGGGDDAPPHRTRVRGYVPQGHTPKGIALWRSPVTLDPTARGRAARSSPRSPPAAGRRR